MEHGSTITRVEQSLVKLTLHPEVRAYVPIRNIPCETLTSRPNSISTPLATRLSHQSPLGVKLDLIAAHVILAFVKDRFVRISHEVPGRREVVLWPPGLIIGGLLRGRT